MKEQFFRMFTDKELAMSKDGSFKRKATREAWLVYLAGYYEGKRKS